MLWNIQSRNYVIILPRVGAMLAVIRETRLAYCNTFGKQRCFSNLRNAVVVKGLL